MNSHFKAMQEVIQNMKMKVDLMLDSVALGLSFVGLGISTRKGVFMAKYLTTGQI